MADSKLINPNPSSCKELKNRRQILSWLALGTAGICTTSPVKAFDIFRRSSRTQQPNRTSGLILPDLPEEWVRQNQHLRNYYKFLASLRLRRIAPAQVIVAHAKERGSLWNSLPPRQMWQNIVPTLRVIDRLSYEMNSPVTELVSIYRSPGYNARCVGASRGSWHQRNVAVDVRFGTRPSQVAMAARHLRKRGLFQGGIGRYNSFTHIDTRGQNVDW